VGVVFKWILIPALIVMVSNDVATAKTFAEDQQRFPRVREARVETQAIRDSLTEKIGIANPPQRIFIRAFKSEQILELWADSSGKYKLLASWPFTAYCGTLGPKRRQGDLQIPEGVYHVDRFNPASNFHLSLGTNYPNKSDRIRKSGNDAGGDIFIHGNRVTIGCIPLGDEVIKILYVFAVDAKSSGQANIPVHIFPCRMDNEANQKMLVRGGKSNADAKRLWKELRPIYDHFEQHRKLPTVKINSSGVYYIPK